MIDELITDGTPPPLRPGTLTAQGEPRAVSPLLHDLAKAAAGTYTGDTPQWSNYSRTVHVFLSMVNGVHTIAFEGTSDFREWVIDFMAFEVPRVNHPVYGMVHEGFLHTVTGVIGQIDDYLKGLGYPPWYLTGHSKGAGEALIMAAEMKSRGHPPNALVVFEPPQVGGAALRDYLSSLNPTWTATVNSHGRDIVTQVPFGPSWCHANDPLLLRVRDGYSPLVKHRMAAVQEALDAMPTTHAGV